MKKIFVWTIWVAFLASSCVACSSWGRRQTQQAREAASIVKLEIDDDGDGEMDGYCTAWSYGEGLWATAGHCAEHDADTSWSMRGVPATLLHWRNDVQTDVAIFSSALKAKPLKISKNSPKFGEWVYYIGYSGGHFGTYTGYWSGNDGIDGQMFTGFTDGGASGSPLFDSHGSVIGIVVASYRGRPWSYATPISHLGLLIDEWRRYVLKGLDIPDQLYDAEMHN